MTFQAFEESLRLIRLLRTLADKLRRRNPELYRQLRRAGSSVSLNLAEGAAREGRDQRHHYCIARGSAKEVQAALRVAEAWGDLNTKDVEESLAANDKLLRLIWGLLR